MSEIIENSDLEFTDSTEIIKDDSEKIEEFTEKMPKQRRYRGQRGQDKIPRRMNLQSMRNLKPFQNLPKVSQNTSQVGLWLVALMVVILAALSIWIVFHRSKNKNFKETVENFE